MRGRTLATPAWTAAALMLSWLLSPSTLAPILPPFSGGLENLVKKADLVVIGTAAFYPEDQAVAAVQEPAEWYDGYWEVARVDASRVLKGKPEQKKVLAQSWQTGMSVGWRFWMTPVPAGERCLLFLEVEDKKRGTYRLMDPCSPVLLAAEPPEGIEKADLRGVLEAELAAAADCGDPRIAARAAKVIGHFGLSGEKPMAALRRLTKSADPDCSANALATRIGLRDKGALVELLKFYKEGRYPPMQLGRVVGPVFFVTAADSLSEIEAFLDLPDVIDEERRIISIREHASYALRCSKADVAKVLPILARLLGDADPEVQYNAVAGMAEHTDKLDIEWRPTVDEFARDPAPYVERWRKWWEKNRAKYAPAKAGDAPPAKPN